MSHHFSPIATCTHTRLRRLALRQTACALAVAAALAAPAAHALTYTWQGSAANRFWDNAANWAGGTGAPPTFGVDSVEVVFGISAWVDPQLTRDYSVLSMTFAAGAPGYTLGGTGMLTLYADGLAQNSSSAQRFNVLVRTAAVQTWSLASGSGALTFAGGLELMTALTINAASTTGSGNVINGVLTSGGPLTKTGAGILTLTGQNTYTGTTTISDGTLAIPDGGSLGSGRIVNNATLLLNRSTALVVPNAISGSGNLNKQGSGTVTLTGANTSTGTTTIAAGALAIGDGGGLGSGAVLNNAQLVFDRSTPLTFANTVSGTGGVTKQGSGTVTLTGASSNTGTTTISAGALAIANGGSLGSGGVVNNAQLVFDRTASLTFANAVSGTGGITKLGGARVTLTGANTYTGGTTITAGALSIGDGGSLASVNPGAVINNALLQFDRSTALTFANAVSGSGDVVKAGSGTVTLTGASTYTGMTTIAAGVLALGDGGSLASVNPGLVVNNAQLQFNRSAALTFANAVSGSGGVTNAGSGMVTLIGASTYTGTTTIAAGTLAIGDGGSLASSSNVVNNATLQFARTTPLTFANAISGTGAVVKAGSGTVTLTGASTYSGKTTVNGGTLAVAGSGSLNSNDINVNAGGSLAISDTGQVTVQDSRALFVSGTALAPAGLVLSGNAELDTPNTYIGINGGTGVVTQTGGLFKTPDMAMGFGAGSVGNYTISGGLLLTGRVLVAYQGTGSFLQTGGSVAATRVSLAGDPTSQASGSYQLDGGTLTTQQITGNSGSATTDSVFRFNGGTLRADTGNASFMQGLTAATVQAGGARIDTSGNNITIAQALLHDSGAGATDGGLTKLGPGTLALTGAGTYTGTTTVAAGVLSIGDGGSIGSGNVLVLNNTTLQFDRTTNLTFANVVSGSGGITKLGGGTVALTSANTYTGNTRVNGGTLAIGTGASLSGTTISVYDGATLAISGNGQVTAKAGSVFAVDGFSSSPAAVLLSGSGRLTTSDLYIGIAGEGAFTQAGGTHTNGRLFVGSGGSGTVSSYHLDGGLLATQQIMRGLAGGAGVFNFNGGTLQALGSSDSFMQGLTAATVQAGGARIDSNGFNVTIGQALLHDASASTIDGGLTKLGSGTFTLTGSNSFNGALTIAAGTLAVASDASLGGGDTVQVGGGGALLFTGDATLARGINLGTSRLTVAIDSTLSVGSGGAVSGGTLGAGGTFAFTGGSALAGATAALNSRLVTAGAVSFTDVTLRGSTTVGSGSTVTATNLALANAGTLVVNGRINGDGLDSSGVTTINSGGTLYVAGGRAVLGGGSRTTINAGGTLAANSPTANLGSIELNGALLVNNGTQSGTLNINFGGVAKGGGVFGNVSVGSGGTFAPGNSPGTATVQNFSFGSGGAYEFELNRATGTPGVNSDLLRVLDTLSVAASNTPGNRFTISIVSLNASNGPAPLADFNASLSYSFLLVDAAQISGYAFDKFNIDSSRFLNDTQGGQFSLALDAANSDLYLVFAPVPEPATWLTMVLGVAGLGAAVRRRKHD